MNLPEHILAQLNELIDEGKDAKEIAFMMRLSPEVVEDEIRKRRLNTTSPTRRAAE